MTMVITNLTSQDYWFGPLHLPAGNGQTLQVDDQSATSLYLTDDSVADAINTLAAATPAKITVVPSAGTVFPRATGVPELLHGDGSPEGIVYAGQGSIYLRRDNTGGAQLYQKTTGIHLNTGWIAMAGAVVTTPTGAMHMYGGTAAPAGWLLCDGSAISRTTYADLFAAIGTNYGAGDGSTTFNIPDVRGRVPVGLGTNASVNALNANDGQSVGNRRPHHRTSNGLSVATANAFANNVTGYRVGIWDGTDNIGGGVVGALRNESVGPHGHSLSGSIGTNNGSDALDTPSFIVVNYIIKT
jgi:microcystin-dependent protein